MPYARIPDELVSDDRYLHAVDLHQAAGTLVLFGYSYAAREASDGFVPDRQLKRWLNDVPATNAAVDALVEAGLWRRQGDGVQMLDYTEAGRNMTAAEWAEKREAARVRKAEWRERQNAERRAADVLDPSGTQESQRDAAVPDAGRTEDETRDDRVPNAVRPSRGGAGPGAQTPIQTQTRIQRVSEETPSTTSSAGAPEVPGGGGGAGASLSEVEHPQMAGARRALLLAGFSLADLDGATSKIDRALKDRDVEPRLSRPNWATFDFDALGRWLAEERREGRARAPKAWSILRYGLMAVSQPGTPGGGSPAGRPSGPVPGVPTVNGVLEFPDPSPEAQEAWESMVEELEAIDGFDAQASVIAQVRPLRINGHVLEITATQSGAVFVEQRVLPTVVNLARRRGAAVLFVPPAEAAIRRTVAA
jgi:hypothetical protein